MGLNLLINQNPPDQNRQAMFYYSLPPLETALYLLRSAFLLYSAFVLPNFMHALNLNFRWALFIVLLAASMTVLVQLALLISAVKRFRLNSLSFETSGLQYRNRSNEESERLFIRYESVTSAVISFWDMLVITYVSPHDTEERLVIPWFCIKNRRSLAETLGSSRRSFYKLSQWQRFTERAVLLPVAIAFHLHYFAVEVMIASGRSMEPTISSGDIMVIDKTLAPVRPLPLHLPDDRPAFVPDPHGNAGRIDTGDIIVVLHPDHNNPDFPPGSNRFMIKRVAAIPGDTYKFEGGIFLRNGVPAKQDFLYKKNHTFSLSPWAMKVHPVENIPRAVEALGAFAADVFRKGLPPSGRVPPGSFLVMGDNRTHSLDSRNKAVGFIPASHVYGRVLLVF